MAPFISRKIRTWKKIEQWMENTHSSLDNKLIASSSTIIFSSMVKVESGLSFIIYAITSNKYLQIWLEISLHVRWKKPGLLKEPAQMDETVRGIPLRANGLFQDGKAHFAGRFPTAQAKAMMSEKWVRPITASRDSKCPVNTVDLADVPMHLREKFIEKLIDKRHYHPLIIGKITKTLIWNFNFERECDW